MQEIYMTSCWHLVPSMSLRHPPAGLIYVEINFNTKEAKDLMVHGSNPTVVVKSNVVILQVIIHQWARVLRPLLLGKHWGKGGGLSFLYVEIYLLLLSLFLLYLMLPCNARSIAAIMLRRKEACWIEPVEVASLTAGPSFVLFDSHVDKFYSRDDGLRASAHMANVPTQSSVFDALLKAPTWFLTSWDTVRYLGFRILQSTHQIPCPPSVMHL